MEKGVKRPIIINTEGYPFLRLEVPQEYSRILARVFSKTIRGTRKFDMVEYVIKVGSHKFYKICYPSLIEILEVYGLPYIFEKDSLFYDENELTLNRLAIQNKPVLLSEEIIDKYHKFEKLYPHQYFGINMVTNRLQFGLFFEMRTGKTITTLIGLSILHSLGKINSGVIVAPPSAIDAWFKETKEHLNYPSLRLIRLTSRTKRWDIENVLNEYKFPLFVFHYEYLITKSFKYQFIPFLKEHYKKMKPVLVLDESHRVKNPRSKRFLNLTNIGHTFKRFYLLSGTPIGNTIENIWSQSVFLGLQHFTGLNISAFRRRYMFPHPAGWGYLPKAQAISTIKKQLQSVSIFVKQSSVFKGMRVFRENYQYNLSKEQRMVYNQVSEELIDRFENGEITVANGLAQSVKLAQICSGFISDKKQNLIQKLDNTSRTKLLIDILSDIDGNVVIWHEFNPDIDILKPIIENKLHRNLFVLAGSTEKQQRTNILEKWRKDTGAILLTKPSLLGEGIDLSVAEVAIYWNHNYSYINRFQSESRILSSKRLVVVLMSLYAPHTIEASILRVLERGKSVDEALKEGNFYNFLKGEM